LAKKLYNFIGLNKSDEKVKGEITAENSLEAIHILKFEMDVSTIISLKRTYNIKLGIAKLTGDKKKIADYSKDIRRITKLRTKPKKEKQTKDYFGSFKSKLSQIRSILNSNKIITLNDEEMEQAIQLAKESILKTIADSSQFNIMLENSGDAKGDRENISTIQRNTGNQQSSTSFIPPVNRDISTIGIGGNLIERLEKSKENKEPIKLDWSIIDKAKPKAVSKVKLKELVLFSHKMSILLNSGILLLDALYIIKDSFKRKILTQTIEDLIRQVQSGESLSSAMRDHPHIFDDFYIAVVMVGESVGSLGNSFADLSKYYKIKLGVQKKAKTASMYPLVTLGVLVIMMVAASKFFLPYFKNIFTSAGVEIPPITQLIFNFADSIPKLALISILAILIHFILYRTVPYYNKKLNIILGSISANAPLIKKYTQIMSLYNFSSTMQIMLKNGISLTDALDLSTHVVQNYIYKVQLGSLKLCVMNGLSFADSIARLDRVDQFTSSMVRVGEESGNLAAAFENIYEYQQESLKEFTDALVEMMQPAMIILLAVIVVPIILGIYLPLIKMTSGAGMNL